MKKVLFALVAMSLLFTACEDGNDDFIKLKEVDDVCTMMDDLKLMEHCYEEYDVNKDGKVSMEEAAAVRDFTITTEISSIKGIEYFPNIEVLLITRTYDLTECNLMNNKKLKSISLGYMDSFVSNISDLNFSKLTNLSRVYLGCVAIKNLNLANGNAIEVDLQWGRKVDTPPACTIWLKAGQILDEDSTFDENYNYTIKYVD